MIGAAYVPVPVPPARRDRRWRATIAQELIDDFFTEVEHSLRELGIGDMGVPKRMKKLARHVLWPHRFLRGGARYAGMAATLRRRSPATYGRTPPVGRHRGRSGRITFLPRTICLPSQDVGSICAGTIDPVAPVARRPLILRNILSEKSPISFEVTVARLPKKGHAGDDRGADPDAARGACKVHRASPSIGFALICRRRRGSATAFRVRGRVEADHRPVSHGDARSG